MTPHQYTPALMLFAASLLGSPLLIAAPLPPGVSTGVNMKLTAQALDDEDLGTRDGGDFNGAGISVRPWVYGLSGSWSAYLLGEAFLATDVIESNPGESTIFDPNDARTRDDKFLALHEFWVDYRGLTAYPGESLRLGRQKLRSADGLWWDSNIEALRWNFDTTLLTAHAGIAQRFSDYRTDLDDLAPQDEERLHLLADINYQWLPGHWAGLKLHHSDDSGSPASNGEQLDLQSKTYSGKLTWLGAELNGDFYSSRPRSPLSYWASATLLTGEVDSLRSATVGDQRLVVGQDSQYLDAWAVDLGLRWNIDEHWRIGSTYSRTSGGVSSNGSDSKQFLQTDLQSNRSTFTGTNSALNRFGEAYRGELNNLEAVSLFAGLIVDENYDASLVYHRFWRVDADQDSANGLQANLLPGEKYLGQEVDLVLTRYFNQGQMPPQLGWLGAKSALVRFRGGVFFPGDAFASNSDSSMYRAVVDFVWRY
jgi:alginate production protein